MRRGGILAQPRNRSLGRRARRRPGRVVLAGKALAALGDRNAAVSTLESAASALRAGGATGPLGEAHRELHRLEKRSGPRAAASSGLKPGLRRSRRASSRWRCSWPTDAPIKRSHSSWSSAAVRSRAISAASSPSSRLLARRGGRDDCALTGWGDESQRMSVCGGAHASGPAVSVDVGPWLRAQHERAAIEFSGGRWIRWPRTVLVRVTLCVMLHRTDVHVLAARKIYA